jgi:glycosyltransferase involved in cell wall biosynthesis
VLSIRHGIVSRERIEQVTAADRPFAAWAVLAHKDDTGFGRQASDVRDVLGFGSHLVIPSERLVDHPVDGISEHWLPANASTEHLRSLLTGLDGILFFERHSWHPRILRTAREMGVATVCVPNWEWFNGDAPEWQDCDLFVCPWRFTEKIVRSYGFTNTCSLPWPIDLAKLPQRTVHGPARHFIHNAGIVDVDDRKGTRDTILAFNRLNRPDIRLTVRIQKEVELPPTDDRVEVIVGNIANVANLYATGDICVQPSKMEGNGFMVLEPACAGLPVITTDYPPMNEFIQQSELRCRPRWRKRRAFATQWIRQAHLKLPSIPDLTRRMQWAATHDLTSISYQNRQWAESMFDRQSLMASWQRALLSIPAIKLNR